MGDASGIRASIADFGRRGEQLIAVGRLALAAFSLLALEIGPSSDERFGEPLELALAVYLGYALALAVAVWRLRALPSWLAIATHVFDLVCFSLLSALSLGPASPYFAFFVFAMVSATIRWQRRGTLWTMAGAMLAFAGLAWYTMHWLEPTELFLHHFLVRSIYLMVMGLLLGYLGRYQEGLVSTQARIAGDRERIRLARDLHDGVSQSLAAAALQLHSAVRVLASDPAACRERVERVLGQLENEQRELRRYQHLARGEAPVELAGVACLRETVERARSAWTLEIQSHGDDATFGPTHPEAWRRQLCGLVHEALSNTARHSGASRAELSMAIDAAGARIRLADDGRGFAFVGVRDLEALEAADLGPRSIRERVRSLGGTLRIASSRDGATLETYLPTPLEEP